MAFVLKIVGGALLALVILACLAVAIVPRFLDRIYYRGPASDHFDGQRFFNPDGGKGDREASRPPGGGSRIGFFWRYFTGRDGRPAWPERVAIHPVQPPARVEGERMVVTWVGHATVLVQTQGLNILTDPVWSDKAGPLGLGPRRVTEPGIAFDRLPKIDLVLVSHNHYDHLDKDTLRRLWQRDRPVFVTSLGNDAIIRDAGVTSSDAILALDWGQSHPIFAIPACPAPDVTNRPPCSPRPIGSVIATRAHHWGSRWGTDRNRALWSGFVVTLPAGGNLFFAGDSGMGDGRWPAEAAAHGPIRLALIPIGAFRFVPGQMSIDAHIGPVEAVEIYRRLGAARAIPIHWGTFRLSYEAYDTPPRLLAAAMACTGQTGFAPVPIGVPTEIAPYAPPAAVPPMTQEALLHCLDTPAVRALR